jgi:drug/metabolite transporter (DMT)-like permease
LFRKEIELARAETSEKISQAGVAAGAIAAGGILALAALIVLLGALVAALGEVMAPALAALIVGGVVAIIAFALIYKGMNDLKASNLAPTRTVEALRRDAHMVKEHAQ